MEIEFKENFEVKNLTTFKIGGTVKCAYFPNNQTEFVELLRTLNNYIILGNCSNVLISSDGYDGNIIFTNKMKKYSIRGNYIIAECGVKGPLLSQKACESGLSGFEFMIGFPGSIGGEVCMNASAHGQSISDNFVKCCIFDKKNKDIIYKTKSEMEFSYRKSLLKDSRYIILGAEFELKRANKEDIKALMDRNLETRKTVQPSLVYPNAGSIFKNPENDSAGRLLEKAGAKNFELDTVKVWGKHANFIINTGNATSTDVLSMMLKMKNAVKDSFTINLEPEIIYVGNKSKIEDKLWKELYQKNQK